MLWVPITISGAFFQILRTSRQHGLRGALPTAAAGCVRYVYAAPLAVGLSVIMFGVLGRPFPTVPPQFWPAIVVAAIAQILGTVALLASFKRRDFSVGTVYSKSEVLIVAIAGLFGIGAGLRPTGWIGALLVTAGVAALAGGGSWSSVRSGSADPAALLGLVAGGSFAAAALGITAASKGLGHATAFERAVLTLTVLLVVQSLLNLAWFVMVDRSQIGAMVGVWRRAVPVGALSLCGSIAWAWAFTLENAAKVRTLGQIELVIAFVIGATVHGERHTRWEILASAVVVAGVVVVAAVG